MRSKLDTVDGIVDEIQTNVDTVETKLDTVDTVVDRVEADTQEIQSDADTIIGTTSVTLSRDAHIKGVHSLSQLVAVNNSTTGTITLDDYTVALTGSASNLADGFAGTFADTYTGALTISDAEGAALTATTLSSIGGATTGTVTVSNAVAITGNHDQLTAALVTDDTKVVASTATVTVNDDAATSITAAELSAIGGKTAGTVTVSNAVVITGNHDQLTAALVTDDTKVVASTATATVSDDAGTAITAAELSAIGGKTSGAVTVSNAVVISGDHDQLTAALVTDDTKVVASTALATVSDDAGTAITAAELSAIGGKTSGQVTVSNAVAITGDHDQLTAALVTDDTKVVASTATVTVSDDAGTAIAASELSTIGGKTSGQVTVSNAVAITGTPEEVTAALVTADTLVVASTATVTITGNPSIAELNAIAAKTDGVVTATLAATSLASLADLTTAGTDNITITVSDSEGDAVTASDLSTLGGKTAGTVTVSNAVVISGNHDQVTAALVTNDTKVVASTAVVTLNDDAGTAVTAAELIGIGGKTSGTVTVSNAVAITGNTEQVTGALVTADTLVVASTATVTITGNPSIAELNAIAAKTDGVVTATLAATSLASLADLTTAGTDAITITVSDDAGDAVTASDLSTLGGKTAGTVTVSNAVVISGDHDQLTAALVTDETKVVASTALATVSDDAGTAITAAELSTIGGKTSGQVTVSNAVVITGDHDQLTAALVTDDTKVVASTALATVSDDAGTAITAAELSTIGGKTSGQVTVSNAVAITGNPAEVTAALVTADTLVVASTATVTITGNPSIAELNAIAAKTDGVVTATLAATSLTSLGDLTTAGTDLITITVSDDAGDAVTASDLSTLGGKTAGTVTVSNAVVISGDHDQLTAALVTDETKVVASTAVVTVSDAGGTAITASELSTIGGKTSGQVTVSNAVVISGDHDQLTAALVTDDTKVVASTALATVSDDAGTAITAAELSAIGGKTSGQVTVSNAVAITGNPEEVTAALVTADTLVVASTATVTITGNPSIAELNAIAAKTDGVVTATLAATSLTSLGDLTTAGTDLITITVSDDAGDAVTASDLSTLGGKTAGTVTVSNAVAITGNHDQVTAALVTDETKVVASTATVTLNDNAGTAVTASELSAIGGKTSGQVTVSNAVAITGNPSEVTAALVTEDTLVVASTAAVTITGNPSIAELNAIAAKTDGVVTATLAATSLASLADLTTAGTDNITITVSDDAGDALTASDLSTLGGKTAGTVTVSNAVVISGDHDQLTAALVTDDTKVVASTALATVNDDAGTSITAAELSAIGGKTSGQVTVSNAVAITGDHDQLTAALVTDDTKVVASTATATVSDGDGTSITAAELSAIGGKTSGTVTVTNAINITGSTAQAIAALVTDDTKVSVTDPILTLSNDPNLTELGQLNAATSNIIRIFTQNKAYTGSANALTAALSGTITDNAGNAFNGEITITGENPTLSQLRTINDGTAGTINLPEAGVDFAGSATELAGALSGGSFTGGVTITGDDPTPTQLQTINNATSGAIKIPDGSVAFTSSSEILAEAFAQTVTDSSGNPLTGDITVNDAGGVAVTASNLSTIGGTTTGTVTVSNAVAITGNAAQVTAALVTADTLVVASTATVTITGNPSIAELNAIAAKTDGVVTTTLAATSLASLADLTTAGTDNITITVSDDAGDAVTASDLSTLGGKTAGTVTVSNAVAITGNHDQVTAALVTDETKVVASTATVTLSDGDLTAITAAELSAIGGATGGTVVVGNVVAITGNHDQLTAALVTDDTKVVAGSATVTVNDDAGTAVTASELSTIGGKTSGQVTVSNAVAITGTPEEVTAALVTADTLVVASTAAVTITGNPSIAELNAIAAKTDGVVTATLAATSLTSLGDLTTAGTDAITITVSDDAGDAVTASDLSTLGGKTAGTVTVSNAVVISGDHDQLTAALVTDDTKVVASTAVVTVSDAGGTAITAAELSAIGGKTSGQVTVSNAVAITGNPADVTAALVTDDTLVVASTAPVTITGNPSIAELNAIAAKTDGVVTATLAATSLTSLGDLTTAGTDNITITVSDDAGDALTASDLSTLGGKTAGTVTVSNAVVITGNAAQVTAALVTEDTLVVASTAAVTITGNPSIAELNAIAAKTDGVVTATLAATSLASLGDLTTAGTDNITITVSDDAGDALTASDLSTLGGKTAGTVTVSNAVVISGNHDQLTAALVTDETKVVASTALATVNDDAGTAITAAELSAIGGKTSGQVTVSNAVVITGDHDQLTAALVTDDTKVVASTALATVSDDAGTAITAAELSTIGGKTSGQVTVTNAVAITGNHDQLTAALVTDETKVVASTATATVNDNAGTSITAAELSAIGGKTSGQVTVTNAINITGSTAQAVAALVTSDTKVATTNAIVILDDTPGRSDLGNINTAISAASTDAETRIPDGSASYSGLTNQVKVAIVGTKDSLGNSLSGDMTLTPAYNSGHGAGGLAEVGGATTGTVTMLNAVRTDGPVASLIAAMVTEDTKIEATFLQVTATDSEGTAINATDLSTIGGATDATVTVSNAVAITGDHDQLTAALVTDDTKVVASTATVTVNDDAGTAITASELSTIGGKTSGQVTVTNAVAITGNHDQLTAALVTDDTKVVASTAVVTVNDDAGTAVTASELSTIGGKTSGQVTVTNAVAITGNPAEVTAALVTADTLVVASTAAVTITGNPSIAELNAIAAKTDGVVTATLAATSLASLADLTTAGTDNITITVSDDAGDAVTASDLSTLGGKTSGTVTVSNAVVISGDHDQLTAALVTNETKVVASTAVVTLNDDAGTAVTAAELSAIGGATSGQVTVSNAVAITGDHDQLTAALVTDDTKVVASTATATVNDDAGTAITAAELSAIGGKTSGQVTVSNAVAITGNHDQLTAALVTDDTKVVASTAVVTLNDDAGTAITALELSTIGGKTSGQVTVSNAVAITGDHDQLTAALVTDDTKVVASTAVVTLNDDAGTAITAAELSAIGGKTSGAVTVSNAVAITGDHDQLTAALVTDDTKVVASTAVVTLNDDAGTAITAAELSAIGGKTSGAVTVSNAVAITGDHDQVTAALVTADTLVEVTDATVTINDADGTAITAAQLSSIGAKTSGQVTVTNAVAITGSWDQVYHALVTDSSKVEVDDATVTITGNPAIVNLNAIAAKTAGVVTATLAATSLASLADLTTAGTDNITITVSDDAGDTLTASDLSTLGGKTAGTVTVSNAVVITGDHDQLTAALATAETAVEVNDAIVTVNDDAGTAITAAELSAIGNKTTGTVTVTNAVAITGNAAEVTAALVTADTLVVASTATVTITGNPSIAELNAIAAKTDGVVTATLAATSLTSLGDLTTAGTDNITITVSDDAGEAVTASDLSTLGGKTAGTVTVSNAVVIAGDHDQLTAALVTDETKVVASTALATVSDDAGTAITAAELSTIGGKTSGQVTVSNAVVITGDHDQLTAALVTDDTKVVASTALATVSDDAGTAITAAELSTIGGKTSGQVTVTNAVAITGNAAQVTAALVTADTLVVASTATVTITGNPSIAELNAIAAKTDGVVTATLAATSLTSLGDLTTAGTDLITITVSDDAGDAVTASDLSTLGGKTAGTVTVSNAVVISGDHDQLTAALVTDETKVVASTAVVTVSDAGGTAITASELSTIGGKTSGQVTVSNAVVISGDHDQLTAALVTDDTKVVASTALATVSDDAGTAITAAELSTIGGKTSGQVTVTNAVAITGNHDQLTAALVTDDTKVVASTAVVTS